MPAPVQCRPQDASLGMVMKEVNGDLPTFVEMRKRENERNGLVHHIHYCDGFDDSTDNLFKMTPADSFWDAKTPKNDYDWLLTPPGTPSFSSMEMAVENAGSQISISNALTTVQISKSENPPDIPSSLKNMTAQSATSTSEFSCVSRNSKPSSSWKKSTASRSATPTARSGLPAASRPSRSSTPTSRGIAASSKPMPPPVRSSTPTRATARASTPPARSLIPSTSKSTSRSATPTLKSSISSSATTISAPSGQSSSVTKTVPIMLKDLGTSRGGSFPIVKSRPKTTSEISVISTDAPSNLRMTVPKRPSSASRGRTTPSSSLSSSSNVTAGRLRQKSCSPSRGRVKDGALNTGKTLLSMSRGYSNSSDDVNPVVIGTKMVERVVNMRKLAPPKHDDHEPHDSSSGRSSSSQENSGFGMSLSKKSLDMAIRHMDITRSISGHLKTIVTSVPASSLSSRGTGSTKTWTTSASDSPLATCSNTSSEPSVHTIAHVLDGSDVEVYDTNSERESSPTN